VAKLSALPRTPTGETPLLSPPPQRCLIKLSSAYSLIIVRLDYTQTEQDKDVLWELSNEVEAVQKPGVGNDTDGDSFPCWDIKFHSLQNVLKFSFFLCLL
jgi:hypothetical protein